jgi:signal transduction histidine kinase
MNEHPDHNISTIPVDTESAKHTHKMWFARLAMLLAATAIAVACVAFGFGVFFLISSGDSVTLIWDGLFSLFIASAYAIVGMLVASRYPRNPIGWIFLTVSWLDTLNLILSVYHTYGPAIGVTGYVPAIFHDLWMPTTLIPTIFVFLLFPDGHLISPRWRIVFWLAALGLVGTHLAVALHPGPLPLWGKETNTDGIPGLAGVLGIVLQLTQLLLMIGILGSLAAFVIRICRAQGIERQQMKWLGYALGLMLLSIVFSAITWLLLTGNMLMVLLSDLMTYLALLGIAVATSIAILRYRLYDIDVVINRTLVYGTLTASVVLIYVLLVGGLGTFFQAQGNLIIALLSTGLVAVLFQPLREWLQRGVNRLIYGERDDPIEALSRLGKQMEVALPSDQVLPVLVKTIAQTLRLPFAGISLIGQQDILFGQETENPVAFPFTFQGEAIGVLLASPRNPGESFTLAEMRLLQNLAGQAGAAVRNAQLTADLQRSRQNIVTAREEERHRLRRDLHDGIGPTMAGLTLKLDAAKDLVLSGLESGQTKELEEAVQLLGELKAQTQETVQNIRHIVHALRPPSLDVLGLIPALQAHFGQVVSPRSLVIQMNTSPPDFPRLSAAVEVAVYRIILEAVTNVIHHAGAGTCDVLLAIENGNLKIEIKDNGVGLPKGYNRGIGLDSMRERADELGGRLELSSSSQGTRVYAQIPISLTRNES